MARRFLHIKEPNAIYTKTGKGATYRFPAPYDTVDIRGLEAFLLVELRRNGKSTEAVAVVEDTIDTENVNAFIANPDTVVEEKTKEELKVIYDGWKLADSKRANASRLIDPDPAMTETIRYKLQIYYLSFNDVTLTAQQREDRYGLSAQELSWINPDNSSVGLHYGKAPSGKIEDVGG